MKDVGYVNLKELPGQHKDGRMDSLATGIAMITVDYTGRPSPCIANARNLQDCPQRFQIRKTVRKGDSAEGSGKAATPILPST